MGVVLNVTLAVIVIQWKAGGGAFCIICVAPLIPDPFFKFLFACKIAANNVLAKDNDVLGERVNYPNDVISIIKRQL